MKKSKRSKIIYSLTIEDIQMVAEQEIDRELRIEEIEQIEDSIAEKINWYEAIADTILQNIRAE